MGRMFIGNPYNNEVSEDSDDIEMDDDTDWDNALFQFPVPLIPGDSTEEDNFQYDEDDEMYPMSDGLDFFGSGEDLEDDEDDEDFDPNDTVYFFSEDDEEDTDFEPGPPVDCLGYIIESDDENRNTSTPYKSSTDNIDELSENDGPQGMIDNKEISTERSSNESGADTSSDNVLRNDSDAN